MTTYFGVNASDPNGPNNGVRCTFIMPRTTNGFPPGACWISEYSSAGIWGQSGISDVGKPFFQVFRNGANIATSKVTGKVQQKPFPVGSHTFEMSQATGNKWHFLVDGRSQGTYDLGSQDAPSSNIVACVESSDGSAPIIFTDLALKRNGVWVPITHGAAEVVMTYSEAPQGVYGNLQDSTIAAYGVKVTGTGNISNGTQLW